MSLELVSAEFTVFGIYPVACGLTGFEVNQDRLSPCSEC